MRHSTRPAARLAALTVAAILTLATAPGTPQLPEPSPCESFSVAGGDPQDVEALKAVVNQLADAYRGSSKSPGRVLRLFDSSRFLSGFTELERNLERDFEVLRNRELVCRRGTLSIQGELAVLQSQWEKHGYIGTGLDRVDHRADVRIQLMKVEGRGQTREWKITGLLGDFFGSTRPGDFADLAVTAFSAPATLPSAVPVTLAATVENRGVQPTATPVTVRFFDTTESPAIQVGGDQSLPSGLRPHGAATVSATGTLPRPGVRRLLVVVDPQNLVREITKENNRATTTATVGGDAVITVIPETNPVTFPTDTVTIRVVDPDQAGKRTLEVVVTHRYLKSSPATPAQAEASREDEEELVLAETRTPGTFELTRMTTGHFSCAVGPPPNTPTKRNRKLQYPLGPECFANLAGTHTGRMTVTYVDPVDARGRVNVPVQKIATTTWPNVIGPFVP